MEKENLTLDDFLSRFQLLRPQVNREALNQRQAAVLIPVETDPAAMDEPEELPENIVRD